MIVVYQSVVRGKLNPQEALSGVIGTNPMPKKKSLTEFQISEIEKCMFSPSHFIQNYVFIQSDSKSELFSLRDYQHRILNGLHYNPCSIVLQPRQTGKTALVTAYLLWIAMFRSNELLGVASYTDRLSMEIVERFLFGYERLPSWLAPKITTNNMHTLAFSNNSKIISTTTTARSFRGMSLTGLFSDELAFVNNSIAENFWASVFPSLSAGDLSKKKIIVTSTPNGSEDLFSTLWFRAESDPDSLFKPLRVWNEEVPGRDEEFKRKVLTTMSETKYARDFGCEFLSEKGTLIRSAFLEAIKPQPPIITHNGLSVFTPYIAHKSLLLAADVAEGLGGSSDFSVIQVFDLKNLEQVAEFRSNTMNLTEFTKYLLSTLNFLKTSRATEIYYTVEGNPIGQSVIQLIKNSTHPVLSWDKLQFISGGKAKERGVIMTSQVKSASCAKLKDLIENGIMTIKSKALISELKFFVKSAGSFSAEKGKHDDLVMGVVVLVSMLTTLAKQDDVAWELINKLDNMDISENESDGSFIPLILGEPPKQTIVHSVVNGNFIWGDE